MTRRWPLVALGEVLTQDRNYIDRPDPMLYPKLSVKLYGRGVILDTPTEGANLRMQRHQLAKAGQVILSEIWGKKGAIGIVPPEGDGALCTSHFFLFDIRRDRVEPGYLQALFSSNQLEQQLGSEARGTTGYAAVRPHHLLAARIPLPPLPEQRRIASRTEKLAAKVEETRHVRAAVSRETEALETAITVSLLLENWPRIRIEELVGREQLANGKSIKSGGDESEIHCLTLSSLRRGLIDCSDTKPVPMAAADAKPFLVRSRDVFVVRGNGSKDLVGRAGIVQESRAGLIFPDLFIRVPLDEERMLAEFFVAVWNSREVRQLIEEKAKTTSGIWKINQSHIASISIPLPELSEQHRVVERLREINARFRLLGELNQRMGAEIGALVSSYANEVFDGQAVTV